MIALLVGLCLFGTVGEACANPHAVGRNRLCKQSMEVGTGRVKQMLGQPDFYPNYGDSGYAWLPAHGNNGLQWVELGLRRLSM